MSFEDAAPPVPATAPIPAGGAAIRWPRFVVKSVQREGYADLVIFDCPACGLGEAVDVETGLCRRCWRIVVLTTFVLLRNGEQP